MTIRGRTKHWPKWRFKQMAAHAWDLEWQRAAIHQAFFLWFQAHEQGARGQAGVLKRRLKFLTMKAEWRRQRLGVES